MHAAKAQAPHLPLPAMVRWRASRLTAREMMTMPHLGEDGVDPVVASTARELLNKSANEPSGVLSTARSFLGLYRVPLWRLCCGRCDWRIAIIPACKKRRMMASRRSSPAYRPGSDWLNSPPAPSCGASKPSQRTLTSNISAMVSAQNDKARQTGGLYHIDRYRDFVGCGGRI